MSRALAFSPLAMTGEAEILAGEAANASDERDFSSSGSD